MNPVHAVLRNWDILQVIITFLQDDFDWDSGRDLVAIALVCRELSDLALNVLWRDIDLENINFLFPINMIRVNPGDTKSLTRIPATPQEWERFDFYASRIRKLLASPTFNELFFLGVRMRYPTSHRPFPNLTSLEWSSTPSRIVDVITLICPTLTEVQLSVGELGADEDEDDDTVADTLRSVGEACPRLRKFEYKHYSITENRSKTIETSLIYLIRQCRNLEDILLPVSHDILRSLASLSHLSALRLDYAKWEDRSQSSLPIGADEWIKEADRFPVLDHLTIQYWHTVSSLTECFQGSGCFPRASFIMCQISECDQWSTLAIAEFFRGILRPDRIEGLRVFGVDRSSAVENHVGHDPWQALRCLSFIPNLHTLSLSGLFLDMNDTDLEEISRNWPELRSLSLHGPHTDEYQYQSQISFQGLAHLSNLKNLEDVSLMLSPDSTISESMRSPFTSSNSPLRYLTIEGKLPPVPLHAATAFLILHFPKLKKIDTSLDWVEGEEERIHELQALLDAARPMNLRSERRSLRSGPGVEQEAGEE